MKKALLFLVIFISIIFSCTKNFDSSPNLDEEECAIKSKLYMMGFNPNNIEIFDDGIVKVEEDIYMDKNFILNESQKGGLKERQNATTSPTIVDWINVSNISFFIDNTVSADWNAAILDAIDKWNSSSSSAVHLTQTASSTANLRFVNSVGSSITLPGTCASFQFGDFARALFPLSNSGNIGNFVIINTSPNAPSSTTNQKIQAMLHEIGHTLGLRHTNANQDSQQGSFLQCNGNTISAPILLCGTPSTDNYSIFNGTVSGNVLNFSYNDIHAISMLYPHTPSYNFSMSKIFSRKIVTIDIYNRWNQIKVERLNEQGGTVIGTRSNGCGNTEYISFGENSAASSDGYFYYKITFTNFKGDRVVENEFGVTL